MKEGLLQGRYLIIGGTSKAGTTSVFNNLTGHPQICSSKVKETRFFLDLDYPLPSDRRYPRDGAKSYASFFPDSTSNADAWKFEATPDYLYGPGTAKWIHQTLPNVRLIFVLREPRSRLLSFYRFGRQRNEIPSTMTFDRFVEMQKEDRCEGLPAGRSHPAFYALAHGRYSFYLGPYFELFDHSQIHVVFQEDLLRDPLAFMLQLCRSCGLDEKYFENHRFEKSNVSARMRSSGLHRRFVDGREQMRAFARDQRWLRHLLRPVGHTINDLYRRMNVMPSNQIQVSPSSEEVIASFYEHEREHLQQLLGMEVPWSSDGILNVAHITAHPAVAQLTKG